MHSGLTTDRDTWLRHLICSLGAQAGGLGVRADANAGDGAVRHAHGEADGAAEAIKIENGSITPTYIQYLWVRQQSDLSDKTVIYIPTETNLPILESTRMNKIKSQHAPTATHE